MKLKIIALLLAFLTGVWNDVFMFFNNFVNDYSFSVDTSVLGDELPNVKSNINRFGGRFPEDPIINEKYDPYEFVDYIQLMECTGGNAARDLFRDPDDFSVIDDYDFEPLLASCRGILKTGARPLLKLGNVPKKLSRHILSENAYNSGEFDVNVYPPDDYNEYYEYIKAVIIALTDEFGIEEVRAWRFGVMTEYENSGWFQAPGGDPDETLVAYCKLYDYTVQALLDILGDDVFVGAHSMTCSEGLFDEREFIKHCGVGTNYANGKIGSRICYLAASYYETEPGGEINVKSLSEIMRVFRDTAESVGLTDLIYGVDEGRILYGLRSGKNVRELNSRTVGYTYQAGFDAYLIKQMLDCGMDYFSSWEYCSLPENHGNPQISYFVAEQAAKFEGSLRAECAARRKGLLSRAEIDAVSSFDIASNTLRIMAYNYKNKLGYKSNADLSFRINAPQFSDGKLKVRVFMIDDDCNWFDEWDKEREELGFTDDKFSWSPDDGCPVWTDKDSEAAFAALTEKYAEYCVLTPEETTIEVENGHFALDTRLDPNAVAFIEITQ